MRHPHEIANNIWMDIFDNNLLRFSELFDGERGVPKILLIVINVTLLKLHKCSANKSQYFCLLM